MCARRVGARAHSNLTILYFVHGPRILKHCPVYFYAISVMCYEYPSYCILVAQFSIYFISMKMNFNRYYDSVYVYMRNICSQDSWNCCPYSSISIKPLKERT